MTSDITDNNKEGLCRFISLTLSRKIGLESMMLWKHSAMFALCRPSFKGSMK
jgi:hypothetical protein